MKNDVKLLGYISSSFTLSHTIFGESFYRVTLSVIRNSGYVDKIPLLVSDRLIDVTENYINRYVAVSGQFRSYNQHEETKNLLKLYVFVNEIEFTEANEGINDTFLEGNLCKKPVYRHTPYGREISDILIAVNRSFNKSDYIPCICWGRNAYYVRSLNTGDLIRVAGRIQSREYNKNGAVKTAYELSVSLLELC